MRRTVHTLLFERLRTWSSQNGGVLGASVAGFSGFSSSRRSDGFPFRVASCLLDSSAGSKFSVKANPNSKCIFSNNVLIFQHQLKPEAHLFGCRRSAQSLWSMRAAPARPPAPPAPEPEHVTLLPVRPYVRSARARVRSSARRGPVPPHCPPAGLWS